MRMIDNHFEIEEDGSVKDRFNEKLAYELMPVKSAEYMKIKQCSGFIQPYAYDPESNSVIILKENTEKISLKNRFSEEELLKNSIPLLLALQKIQENGSIFGNLDIGDIFQNEFGFVLKSTGNGIKAPIKYNSAYEFYAFQGKGVPASDVYSVCAMFYKMLSGQSLPKAEIRYEKNMDPKPLPDSISEKTRKAIEKGINLFASDRQKDIKTLIEDLIPEEMLQDFTSNWNIYLRKIKKNEESIDEKLQEEAEQENRKKEIEAEKKKEVTKPTFWEQNKKMIFLAGGIILVLFILVVIKKAMPTQTTVEDNQVKEIKMSAMPVQPVSGTSVSEIAVTTVTPQAVTTEAVTIAAVTPVETTPQPTITPTIKATAVPTVTPAPTKTPKPKKKPKVTKKPKIFAVITAKPKATKKPTVTPIKPKSAKPTKKKMKEHISIDKNISIE